jgi:16S rRNA (guanine(527)-N(7))-methyltransferase RsmG
VDRKASVLARVLRETLPGARLGRRHVERLEALDRLLVEWSGRMDLTGFDSPTERALRYFAEPLAAGRWIGSARRALDIGSGGGSPALPLAVVFPEVAWTLVESRRKKARFLEQAIETLELPEAVVVAERYEAVRSIGRFDIVTLRGVRVERKMRRSLIGELVSGGRLLWFSGRERLETAKEEMTTETGLRLVGPRHLIPGGGWLLVVERT